MVVLRPNRYTPGRANLAIVNFGGKEHASVDVRGFLREGAAWRLKSPYDFFGPAVATGAVQDGTLRVPLDGPFAAFVLLPGEQRRGDR